MANKVFLTGSTGFVGRKLLQRLLHDGFSVVAPVRSIATCPKVSALTCDVITDVSDLAVSLAKFKDIETVIHVAAKAHASGVTLEEFRRINTQPTVDLVATAAAIGVKRFIFISSIGVNGIQSTQPFSVFDEPNPTEDYAVSKFEAENLLKQKCAEEGIEFVVIRPPLVYGAGATGNFGKLIKLARLNLPMPLGAIQNQRSFVAVDNLVDLICCCIHHSNAANQTFLVSDDHDLSTSELLCLLIQASGAKPRLFAFPTNLLFFLSGLVGAKPMLSRLCGDLQVDISYTKQTLNWHPPVSLETAIADCFIKNPS